MDLIIDTERKRKLMVVRPVKALLNSKLISDVITSGRKFVVDLDTGELTVYSHAKSNRTSGFHFLRYGDKIYDLPSAWSMETEEELCELYMETFTDGNSYLYYGEDRTIRVIASGGWKTFKDNAKRYYEMVLNS